jgi:hypothetical protein
VAVVVVVFVCSSASLTVYTHNVVFLFAFGFCVALLVKLSELFLLWCVFLSSVPSAGVSLQEWALSV